MNNNCASHNKSSCGFLITPRNLLKFAFYKLQDENQMHCLLQTFVFRNTISAKQQNFLGQKQTRILNLNQSMHRFLTYEFLKSLKSHFCPVWVASGTVFPLVFVREVFQILPGVTFELLKSFQIKCPKGSRL